MGPFALVFPQEIPNETFKIPFISPLWTSSRDGTLCIWNSTDSAVIKTFTNYIDSAGKSLQGFEPTLIVMTSWKDFEIVYRQRSKVIGDV